jgi:hypothetical protein
VTLSTPAKPGRRWRSRAFAQPLLATIVGVVGSVVLYLDVVRLANGPSDGPCTMGPDSCGYIWIGAMTQAVALLPVLLVGQILTGFVVGRSSSDTGLALRAILTVFVVPLLLGFVIAIVEDVGNGLDAQRIVSHFLGWSIGLVLVFPIAIGFAVGSGVRPRPKDQSESTGPE